MEPTELQRLLVKEVSGVDDPANEIPGWMVAKAAADLATTASPTEDAPTFVARLRKSLGLATGKDIDMTADELTTTLTANNEALAKSIVEGVGAAVADAVAKSVPAPAEAAAAAAPAAEAAPAAVTMEAIEAAITAGVEAGLTKAIEGDETTKGVNDILGAVIDRVAQIEKAFGVAARTSLDGQESAAADAATDATKSKEKAPAVSGVQSAISKALRNPGKPVFLAGSASDGAAL